MTDRCETPRCSTDAIKVTTDEPPTSCPIAIDKRRTAALCARCTSDQYPPVPVSQRIIRPRNPSASRMSALTFARRVFFEKKAGFLVENATIDPEWNANRAAVSSFELLRTRRDALVSALKSFSDLKKDAALKSGRSRKGKQSGRVASRASPQFVGGARHRRGNNGRYQVSRPRTA